ncbi:MAG: glycolate oxidase subunit GlcF [Hydrogenophilus sp.]|nr:glycolate oxidase subunit GlcF [Hydrogenophilus sp.]
MEVRAASLFAGRNWLKGVEEELRRCVHCGFCTASCPTYRLLGDELDGPRGRIYLVKELVERGVVTRSMVRHFDRCLTCRACERSCPSGVQYHRVVAVGRAVSEEMGVRPFFERWRRGGLAWWVTHRALLRWAVGVGRTVRPFLPKGLARLVPPRAPREWQWPSVSEPRERWWLLEGCVQPVVRPEVDQAAATVLGVVGVEVAYARGSGCCGAVDFHLGRVEVARARARANVRAWWPAFAAGERKGVVATASGCAAFLREYGELLEGDEVWGEAAAVLGRETLDVSELVARFAGELRRHGREEHPNGRERRGKVVFQAPCSLQHGLGIVGVVEGLLEGVGWQVVKADDDRWCCGSAGTYSVLERGLAARLGREKGETLAATGAEVVATANIGCLLHLSAYGRLPVRHWLELVAERVAREEERVARRRR